MNESVPVQLEGAGKVYPGGITAARDLSLTVPAGQTMALLGPNGAGKTTTIRMILGLARPTTGTARVFGRDPRDAAARVRIGTMLQTAEMPATLTVREHITLFSAYYPRPLSSTETLRTAALEDVANRRSEHLSGGQRQRLAFALAICGDPDLLVLDEPTTNLDIESRFKLAKDVGFAGVEAGPADLATADKMRAYGRRSARLPRAARRSSSRRTTSPKPTRSPNGSR